MTPRMLRPVTATRAGLRGKPPDSSATGPPSVPVSRGARGASVGASALPGAGGTLDGAGGTLDGAGGTLDGAGGTLDGVAGLCGSAMRGSSVPGTSRLTLSNDK